MSPASSVQGNTPSHRGLDPDDLEDMLDQAYSAIVDEDSVLLAAFRDHQQGDPSAYAPV